MSVIQLSRAGVRALLLFTARHDIRYYLNGIKVEATSEATRIIATNGHILGVHHSAQTNTVEKPTELIVPYAVVSMIRKAKAVLPLQLEGDGLNWSLRDYALDYTLGFKPIEGRFPDYMKVIPKKASGKAAQFNPDYIGVLSQVTEALGSKGGDAFVQHNGDDGAVVTIGGQPEFFAVLMPLRTIREPTRPEWIDVSIMAPAKAPAKEAA